MNEAPDGSLIVSRRDAHIQGLRYYYTGEPCFNGHVDFRRTSNDVCLSCGRERSRAYGRRNIQRIVNNFRVRMYGVNNEEFHQMIIDQEKKCAICKDEFENTRDAHLDHNHKTGISRLILCSNCNTGLGLFKDNIELLETAIQYLKDNDQNGETFDTGNNSSEWK